MRFGADLTRFHVLYPGGGSVFADLAAALERVQPVLLVVDTLGTFAEALVKQPHQSAEWNAVLLPLLDLARARNIAVVVCAHSNKSEGGGYRDSSQIGALFDFMIELQPDTANPARRNADVLGRWPAPNFAFELAGDAFRLVAGGELSLDAQVLAIVQQHPGSSGKAVRDLIGGRGAEIDAALARLVGSGAVRDERTGVRHSYVPAAGAPVQSTLGEELDDVPF